MKFSVNGGSRKGGSKFNDSGRSAPRRDRRERRGAPVGLIVFLVIVALLLGGGGVGYVIVNREVSGNRGLDGQDVVVIIPEGASVGETAELLKEQGIIGSVNIFKAYNKIFPQGEFQFGAHRFSADMHYDEVIRILQEPTLKEYETFSITFPEGTTSLKMAMMLEEIGVCTVDEFLDACNNDTFSVGFMDQITSNPNKFIRLEGFLYPDTYEFLVGASAHDIIETMLKNFEEKVLTPEILAKIESSGYTLEEVIILASIIEKESFGGEQYMVSSVFHNRLAPGSPVGALESDTTYYFIYGVLDYYYGNKSNVPAGMRDSYNSYEVDGIIVGAICNPGAVMVDAALSPADTPYLFFVTDDNKKFYWGITADDHAANCAEADRVNAALRNG